VNGYIASSVSQLQTGGLYFSLNWVLFCYPSLESIRFVTTSKILNLYCVGETNEELANKYLNRINSYIGHNFNHLMSIYIIPKKDSFLVLQKEEKYYKILYKERIGYIQPLTIFKIRESVERL